MSRGVAFALFAGLVVLAFCDHEPAPAPTVYVVPAPIVVPLVGHDRRVDLLQARTEYLHTVIANLCKPDGFGLRVHPPEPPPGWSALRLDRE